MPLKNNTIQEKYNVQEHGFTIQRTRKVTVNPIEENACLEYQRSGPRLIKAANALSGFALSPKFLIPYPEFGGGTALEGAVILGILCVNVGIFAITKVTPLLLSGVCHVFSLPQRISRWRSGKGFLRPAKYKTYLKCKKRDMEEAKEKQIENEVATINHKIDPLEATLDNLNTQLNDLKAAKKLLRTNSNSFEKSYGKDAIKEHIVTTQERIADLKKEIAVTEKELATLEKQRKKISNGKIDAEEFNKIETALKEPHGKEVIDDYENKIKQLKEQQVHNILKKQGVQVQQQPPQINNILDKRNQEEQKNTDNSEKFIHGIRNGSTVTANNMIIPHNGQQQQQQNQIKRGE